MKLIKTLLLAFLVTCSASSMANEVIIKNRSGYPIPVKYQIAHHNPGKPVALKQISHLIVYGNSQAKVSVPQNGYQHAGVVIVAVKVNSKWKSLPSFATQFNGLPGCWVSTDKRHFSRTITLKMEMDSSDGKHGRITCSVKAK